MQLPPRLRAAVGRAIEMLRDTEVRWAPANVSRRCLGGGCGNALAATVVLAAATAGSIAVAHGSETARRSQDPLAPLGARPSWLPCEDWAMYHWVPYDERQLFSMLGRDRAAVERWLEDDDIHTLAQLVRRRGLNLRDVAEQLVFAWAGEAPSRQYALLLDRALRTLTEGHLAQHVFFHFAHYPAVALQARAIFGISPLSYQRLRMAGWTPREIAQHGGRTALDVRIRTLPLLRDGARLGVAGLHTPPAQARRLLALQRVNLAAWLEQRIRPLGRARRRNVPRLRSRRELACWLFAGRAGLEQVRRPGRTRAASLVCALPAAGSKERE